MIARTSFDALVDMPAALSVEPPMREMTLADIVTPWVWAYPGHVLPNGKVMGFGEPMWHSNDPTWHGI
jgi:hypothetical protein